MTAPTIPTALATSVYASRSFYFILLTIPSAIIQTTSGTAATITITAFTAATMLTTLSTNAAILTNTVKYVQNQFHLGKWFFMIHVNHKKWKNFSCNYFIKLIGHNS